jgi:hypothetical protein
VKPSYEVWVEKNERMFKVDLELPDGKKVDVFGEKTKAVDFASAISAHDEVDRVFVVERRIVLTIDGKNDKSGK